MKSACLNASMQSIRLHFGESANRAAEASTTEAAKEVRYLLYYSVSLMLKLVSGLGPVQKGSADGSNGEDEEEEEEGAAA